MCARVLTSRHSGNARTNTRRTARAPAFMLCASATPLLPPRSCESSGVSCGRSWTATALAGPNSSPSAPTPGVSPGTSVSTWRKAASSGASRSREPVWSATRVACRQPPFRLVRAGAGVAQARCPVCRLLHCESMEDLRKRLGCFWAYKPLSILQAFPDATALEIGDTLAFNLSVVRG